jgi:hypothetical protein
MSRQARFAERERNQRWLGDDASDKVGRDRARRWFADTGTCSRPNCSRVAERHHIDGNTRNNAAENIAFLCHAHHMQVELGGKPKPEDMRRKISATLKGRKLPAAHRAAVSEGVRQWWARRKMVVDA